MSTDELDEYEDIVDHDEALVTELEDERLLSDGDELADADAERDTTPFDDTRCIYPGVMGNGDDVDVRELRSAGRPARRPRASTTTPTTDRHPGNGLRQAGVRASTSTWTTTNTASGAIAHDSKASAMSASSASSLSPYSLACVANDE